MAEYEIRFSQAREDRGMKPWAILRLEARDQDGDFWKGISAHDSAEEAKAALAELQAKDGE